MTFIVRSTLAYDFEQILFCPPDAHLRSFRDQDTPELRDGARGGDLQSRSFRQIYPEAIPATLIFTGHLGAGMAELLLDVSLIDLRR